MKAQMSRVKTKTSVFVFVALLFGCTPQPKETNSDDAQTLVNAMTYVKAKNGVCFGVVTVDRVSSNAIIATNQMIVPVECSKIGL
jgi:hypothetical protein